jgi:hypothetical protein
MSLEMTAGRQTQWRLSTTVPLVEVWDSEEPPIVGDFDLKPLSRQSRRDVESNESGDDSWKKKILDCQELNLGCAACSLSLYRLNYQDSLKAECRLLYAFFFHRNESSEYMKSCITIKCVFLL